MRNAETMSSSETLLIIGAGNAGAELAFAARQQGWMGPIVLVGAEPALPYHRPPLSKGYLSNEASADSLTMRPASAYEKAGVTLRVATRVERLDRSCKSLVLSDGTRLGYAKLALCVGSRPRELAFDGVCTSRAPRNLHYLRTQADVDVIRPRLQPGSRLLVIGGGYIGLEVAASARKLGVEVTVLEAQPRVLARVTGPELSAFYEGVHRDAGVDLRTGVTVRSIECKDGDGAVRAVICGDGTRIEVDVVIVGAGVVPNIELAAAAGLDVEGGIVVDEFAQTSDPDIYAAGDCTAHPSALYGRRVRLESVPNALEQARIAAAALCGKPKAYNAVPWFWSDQYDLKLQMVGLSEGYDQFVLRGSTQARAFVGFYLREGRLLAADAVNRPADFMMAKRLVAASARADAARLADESLPLKELLAAPATAPLISA